MKLSSFPTVLEVVTVHFFRITVLCYVITVSYYVITVADYVITDTECYDNVVAEFGVVYRSRTVYRSHRGTMLQCTIQKGDCHWYHSLRRVLKAPVPQVPFDLPSTLSEVTVVRMTMYLRENAHLFAYESDAEAKVRVFIVFNE